MAKKRLDRKRKSINESNSDAEPKIIGSPSKIMRYLENRLRMMKATKLGDDDQFTRSLIKQYIEFGPEAFQIQRISAMKKVEYLYFNDIQFFDIFELVRPISFEIVNHLKKHPHKFQTFPNWKSNTKPFDDMSNTMNIYEEFLDNRTDLRRFIKTAMEYYLDLYDCLIKFYLEPLKYLLIGRRFPKETDGKILRWWKERKNGRDKSLISMINWKLRNSIAHRKYRIDHSRNMVYMDHGKYSYIEIIDATTMLMHINLAIGSYFGFLIDIKMEEVNQMLELAGAREMDVDELLNRYRGSR